MNGRRNGLVKRVVTSYCHRKGEKCAITTVLHLLFFFSFLSCGAALCTLSRSLHEAWSSWFGQEGWLGRWCLTAATAAAVFRSISSFPHELKKPSSSIFFWEKAPPMLPRTPLLALHLRTTHTPLSPHHPSHTPPLLFSLAISCFF